MNDRVARYASLAGVLFALLGAAAFASSNGAPDASADGRQVIRFYVAHGSAQRLSDTLWGLAFAAFVVFAAILRRHLVAVNAGDWLGSLGLAGAAILCAGATTFFGCDYVLAASAGDLTPDAAQAVNTLALNLFAPAAIGGLVATAAIGAAILASRGIPRWLGVAAIVIGIAFVTPLALGALVALFAWSVATSVVVFRRLAPAAATRTPAADLTDPANA